jgi:Na+/phosphate symporter
LPAVFALGAKNSQEAARPQVKTMKNLFRSFLTLLFVLSLAASGIAETLSSEKDAAPNLKITVLVYNMTKVPNQILAQAEGEASRIFREAGMEMEWIECPCFSISRSSERDAENYPATFWFNES